MVILTNSYLVLPATSTVSEGSGSNKFKKLVQKFVYHKYKTDLISLVQITNEFSEANDEQLQIAGLAAKIM